MALVFQETFLFADTLWENVTLGADVTNDEVRRALSIARADRFVGELPLGVATVVGERGVTLSGGQRQRIALARALLRQPRALILDDATSAVDPVVESEILDGLRRELSTTTLVVAQRVSTIELADRVAFLDGGRIVGRGLARPAPGDDPGLRPHRAGLRVRPSGLDRRRRVGPVMSDLEDDLLQTERELGSRR